MPQLLLVAAILLGLVMIPFGFPGTLVQSQGPLEIAMQTSRAGNTPLYAPAEGNSLLPDHSPGLRRTVVAYR